MSLEPPEAVLLRASDDMPVWPDFDLGNVWAGGCGGVAGMVAIVGVIGGTAGPSSLFETFLEQLTYDHEEKF